MIVTNVAPRNWLVPSITLTFVGDLGQVYMIQRSPDLKTWTNYEMVTNETGSIQFTDIIGTNTSMFYRTVLVR